MGLTWNGAEARERLCCGGEGLGFQGRRGKGIRVRGEKRKTTRRCAGVVWLAGSPGPRSLRRESGWVCGLILGSERVFDTNFDWIVV